MKNRSIFSGRGGGPSLTHTHSCLSEYDDLDAFACTRSVGRLDVLSDYQQFGLLTAQLRWAIRRPNGQDPSPLVSQWKGQLEY